MKKQFRSILNEKGRKELPNILLAAAECAPLSKTGGLADVVGTLPKALKKLGFDARVITPYHRCIKDKYASQVEHMFDFYVNLGWRTQYCGIERLELDGVCIYLVDSEFYFGDKIYRGGQAEGEQYAFFTRAVLDAIPNLGFKPDIVHCNDWHTAMLPMLAKTQYGGAMQSSLRWLLTIHNIAYQGKFGFDYVQDLLGVEDKYYTSEFMELNGCADFLKAGDFSVLMLLHSLYKVCGIHKAFVCSSVKPREALTEQFHIQAAVLQINAVQIGDLKLSAGGWIQIFCKLDHTVIVEIETRHAVIAFSDAPASPRYSQPYHAHRTPRCQTAPDHRHNSRIRSHLFRSPHSPRQPSVSS